MGRRPRKVVENVQEEASPTRAVLPLIDLVGLALIAIRWFTPTEGTFRGDTLWISQLWLGWGVLAAWSAMREEDRWARRDGLWMWGLVLLVAGHVVSGLAVVLTEGQKRAALNGLWEWVSLGIAAVWFFHRASSGSFRRTFRITLIASAIGLSALGIWQRWVSQPALGQAVIEFDELEAKLPTLEGLERRNAESKLRKLNETLGPDYRSLDVNGRKAMRLRLLQSTEPLGRFALTNSLAALLLVALCLASGEAIVVWSTRATAATVRPTEARWARLGMAAAASLLAFVFLLTKSRSATIGGLVGGGIAVARSARGRTATVLSVGLIGLGLVIAAAVVGGLDRFVVTEAAKSLEYRREYWTGAWSVILEHPILGVGPGNFRQHYLAHKLAKSSEEVLDPHNFLLEAWATAGLMGIAGLVALLATGLMVFRRTIPPDQEGPKQSAWRSSAPAILVVAGIVLVGVGLLLEGSDQWELGATMAIAILSAIALNRIVPVGSLADGDSAETATQAAWFGLSVHLLGAGGMEMPAIIQLWLCLSALIVAPRLLRVEEHERQWPARTPGAVALVLVVLFIGQLWNTTIPAMDCRTSLNLALADAAIGARFERIDDRLKEATGKDRFDPEPWRLRAQVAFREWSRTHESESFDRAIEYQREAIARDPQHAHDDRDLAELFLGRFAVDHRPQDAEAAVEAARQALKRYPNQLSSRRTLADALKAAGKEDEARDAARATIELDALWLNLAHYDKVLTDEERARMKSLAGDGM
ncbi:hypothetical protein AYO47_01990 [Planctomyces sp. SCGC AG-212-M04]|nr:hypothetical protein AYO47_01990 [Planctomyces sp. SCGC AG-212-M04]